MAARNFAGALSRVLAHEGGYTNHPSDPGGPTNWGITIHDARRFWKRDATAADVKAMPREVASRIYKSKYWDALRCDDLPSGVDYCVFDYGVNSGIGRSGKVLRRALAMSDKTSGDTDDVVAASNRADSRKLIAAVCEGYVDLHGKTGDYQEHHKVYARDGLACRRCRTAIQKARFTNRTTYYWPQCQV